MADTATVQVIRAADTPFRAVQGDGAAGLSMARLYRPADGSFTFQLARIEPGGVSRRHSHTWEQVNWVAGGAGVVEAGDERLPIAAGDCIIFPGGIEHAITCTGAEPLLLIAVLGSGAR